jgi:hypothetical protein
MQAPGGAREDASGGFELEGWSVNYWDEAMGQRMPELMCPRSISSSVVRPTRFLPHTGHRAKRSLLDHLTRRPNMWSPIRSTVSSGGRRRSSRVTSLRRSSGSRSRRAPELQVHGSSDLLQTLIKHELIDRYNLMIFPVVLGRGKRLFADRAIPTGLRQTCRKTASTGVIMATYEPAGHIRLGTFTRPDE